MDALYIALLLTLPIIIAGAALYAWVRRAPDEDRAQRRIRILCVAGITLLVIAMFWRSIGESRWYRYLRGHSVIEFNNERGVVLGNVEFITRQVANGEQNTHRLGTMPRGSKYIATGYRDGSEVVLEEIRCVLNGQPLVFTNAGSAKRGDRLVIRIEPTGRLVMGDR